MDGSVDDQHEQGQQEQHEDEQEWEEGNNDGGGFPPSRQPDAPSSVSATQLLGSSMVTESQSLEAVQDDHLRTQRVSRVVSPTREVLWRGSDLHISVQDIIFLHVEGQRETARDSERQRETARDSERQREGPSICLLARCGFNPAEASRPIFSKSTNGKWFARIAWQP